MQDTTFIDLILEHFDYLLHNSGFAVVHQTAHSGFAPQVTTFASGRCIVAFVLDRGEEVYIEVGSADDLGLSRYGLPDPSFEIGIVIAFLTPGMTTGEMVGFYSPIDRTLPARARVDQRLKELAQKTRPFWERVLALCASGELNHHRSEFEQLDRKRGEAIMRSIFGKTDRGSTEDKPG